MLDSKKFSYKNTLIYTIITAIVSVGLLVLLAFKGFFDYIYLIAIVELGIFCIIGYCIFRIINYEKGLDRMKLNSNNFIAFNECPDYFVKKFDTSGTPYCSNEYQVKDKVNNSYIEPIKHKDSACGGKILFFNFHHDLDLTLRCSHLKKGRYKLFVRQSYSMKKFTEVIYSVEVKENEKKSVKIYEGR